MSIKDSAWRIKEKVIASLESTINPGAAVLHDVLLPVKSYETDSKRQCDIVIKFGEEPNQVLTIIEVQDRNSKPDINTFSGWVEKMRDVGAQHLFCVSNVGFPKSIIEKADSLGPMVRLMKLSDLERGDWPKDIPNGHHEGTFYTLDEKGGRFDFDWEKRQPPFNTIDPNHKCLRIGKNNQLYSLANLFAPLIGPSLIHNPPTNSKKINVTIRVLCQEHYLIEKGAAYKFRCVELHASVKSIIKRFPVILSNYVQVENGNQLGWILRFISEEGQEIHCPLTKTNKYQYITGTPIIKGFRPNQNVIVTYK